MANVNRDIWVLYDDGNKKRAAFAIKTHFDLNLARRAYSLSNVSDLISACISEKTTRGQLGIKLDDFGTFTIHLPRGVTRETSGLDANCFLENTRLRNVLSLTSLLDTLINSNIIIDDLKPLIIKSETNDNPQEVVIKNMNDVSINQILTAANSWSSRDHIVSSLYKLAKDLGLVLIPETSFKSTDQQFKVRSSLFKDFTEKLIQTGVKVLVLDEVLDFVPLVEFLVKENYNNADLDENIHFIISGTPPHGDKAIDYGLSAQTRCGAITVTHLNCYEVYSLLQFSFGQSLDVSTKTWLDLWTIFGGDGFMYQQFHSYLGSRNELKDNLSKNGLDDKTRKWCFETLESNAKIFSGIDSNVAEQVGGSVLRSKISPAYQRDIRQLLDRGILRNVVKVSDFLNASDPKPTTIIWNDFLAAMDQTSAKSPIITVEEFRRRRGLGLENMLVSLINWHMYNNTLDEIIDLGIKRLYMCTLSYEGGTDADLLLIEHPSSRDKLDSGQKLKIFIFNVKSHPSSLVDKFGAESKEKFNTLCSRFSEKYDVTLCLVVENLDNLEPKFDATNLESRILQTWSGMTSCHLHQSVLSLQDFKNKAMGMKIECNVSSSRIIVERSRMKHEILKNLEPGKFLNLLIQGRYRVGKTTLLQELCNSNNDWRYLELKGT